MDISGSLVTALMLLMAKYIPADKPVATPQRKTPAVPSASDTQVNPQVIAAITSAVQQYRKAQSA